MGREPWSRAYYLSPSLTSLPAYEPILQAFMRALLLHGRMDSSFQTDYKSLYNSGESNSTTQLCLSSVCFLECPWLCQTLHGLIPCYEGLEWLEEFLCIGWLCFSFQRLVEQEDQLLQLEEFLWHHLSFLTMIIELFWCLQGLKCVDTFPLFTLSNAHQGKPQTSFPRFPSHREMGIF